MRLICLTSSEDFTHASLDLTPELARKLLLHRDVVNAIGLDRESFYGVTWFNHDVAYGTDRGGDSDLEHGSWYDAGSPEAAGVDFEPLGGTCCESLVATEYGVLWQGSPKHSSSPETFETQELSWAFVETVAGGGDPFAGDEA